MISIDAYFREHPTDRPGPEVRSNATTLLARVNGMLSQIDLPEAQTPKVRSGWRPDWYNKTVPGAAPNSKHVSGEAIDLADDEGALDAFLMSHPQHLIDHGLWMEHPAATKSWCHLQSVPPRSNNRVFYP